MLHMMEEKAQEQSKDPPKKVHFSLFKKRKKAKIRSIIVTQKSAREKKFFLFIFLIVFILFVIVVLLFGLRQITNLSFFQGGGKSIIVPIVEHEPTRDDIVKAFDKTHLSISTIENASNSAIFEIKLENGPKVIISSLKNVDEEVVLVDSIIRRLTIENKNPVVIDLRYNKPIVKF